MTTCVLYNSHAGSADEAEAMIDRLRHADGFEICATGEDGDIREEAARAARRRPERVVAVGGDGTISQVVNGLVDALGEEGLDAVTFGVIPMGTGNDFARTLALPANPALALAHLEAGAVRKLDLIRVTAEGQVKYGVNACAGGLSGEVDLAMSDGLKETWGPIAYLVGTAQALPNIRDHHTTLAWGEEAPSRVDALSVVVANGRSVGGGKPAAPRANPEDGLLDVVVIHDASVLELAGLAARAFTSGDYLHDDRVTFRRTRRLRVESTPGMWFNIDGELHTRKPVTFEVVPGVLPVIVGPSYQAEVPVLPHGV